MRHPFDLNIDELQALNLDEVDSLTDEQSASIQGGVSQTLTAVGPNESGESGGNVSAALSIPPEGGSSYGWPIDFPKGFPYPHDDKPDATTLAIGEEGG
ncbi:MAG: hypothetical protein HC851_06060 [Acaryochloris sp. RU_4_1]|nr:hypothetical protein [Acaryochloris sp. RU_4_1]NJR55516.1 hypothetical protein [Acaryochloris sp. CRU_2_0]